MVTKTEHLLRAKPVNLGSSTRLIQNAPEDDPFRYGWRTIKETLPDGKIIIHDIALTQADFLNPQLGDHMVQSDPHFRLVNSLYDRFNKHYLKDATTGVFSDLKMLWGIPDVKEPVPDLAVVMQLKDKQARRKSFDVVKEGTRPCLLVEVISPDYPGDDTTKVDIYEQVGISEYIIIDPHFENETSPVELLGYRLVDGVYQAIRPDAKGRLLSETTGVWFGLDESKRALVLVDAATGKRLLDDEEEHEARLEAETRAEAEARRANAETRRAIAAEAEITRLKALLAQKDQ